MSSLITPGFHHITFVSANAERTIHFYRDLLGLSQLFPGGRPPEPEAEMSSEEASSLWFGDAEGSPGSLIQIQIRPDDRRGGWGVGGIHHLALGVEDEGAQLMWKRRLTDAGVPVSGPYDRGYFHSIYFSDPDGHILEVATQGPGYDLDEPMDRLGQEFVHPAPQRLRGKRDEDTIRERTHPEPVPEVSSEMALQGIHHITGITDELDQAHRFYTEALGLRLVKKTVNQDDGETHHYFWANYDGTRVAPGSSYTLFGWPGSRHRAREGVGQTHLMAFRARGVEELEEWADRLHTMGISTEEDTESHPFPGFLFRAPDGMLVRITADEPISTLTEGEHGP